MTGNNKLYYLLKLRRRIHRKILLDHKWTSQYSIRSRIAILQKTKSPYSLWANDKGLYFLINKTIEQYATKKNLIQPYSAFEIESVDSCAIIPSWFETLKEYEKKLNSFGAKLIVQGSYADIILLLIPMLTW